MEDRVVLLHKKLSFSDLADTVLQTGRIVLPRNQMEVNADQIINLANKGARYINHDNNKATYELIVTDAVGRQWELLLKQWTANNNNSPRPIYVLERTSACMKAHKAVPGHFLQAYVLHSDSHTLRMTVSSPNSITGAAAAAASAQAQAQQQQLVRQQKPQTVSGIDFLLQVVSQQQQEEREQQQQTMQDRPQPPPLVTSPAVYGASTPPTTTTAAAAAPNVAPPGSAAAGAGYILGICQRTPECYKESGHPGFCSSGYKHNLPVAVPPPPRPAATASYLNNNSSTAPSIVNAASIITTNFNNNKHGFQHIDAISINPPALPSYLNSDGRNKISNKNVNYFGRNNDQIERRSPADALNAAALQLQRQQKEQKTRPRVSSSPSPPPAPLPGGGSFFDNKAQGSSRVLNRRIFQAPLNAPLYDLSVNVNQRHPTVANKALSPFQIIQQLAPKLTDDATTTARATPPPNPYVESCPTTITIRCGGLRGELHIPSMTVSIYNSVMYHKSKNDNSGPVSVRAFQLIAQTVHLDHKTPGINNNAGTIFRGVLGGDVGNPVDAFDCSVITVEGAGMSLQRWLKSWDLPMVPGLTNLNSTINPNLNPTNNAQPGDGIAGGVDNSAGGTRTATGAVLDNGTGTGNMTGTDTSTANGTGGGYWFGEHGFLHTPHPNVKLVCQPQPQPPAPPPPSSTMAAADTARPLNFLQKQQQREMVSLKINNITSEFAAAMAATGKAIEQAAAAVGEHTAVTAAVKATAEAEAVAAEAASRSSLRPSEDGDGSGSTESEIEVEAGEVLLSMMGIMDKKEGRKREREKQWEKSPPQKRQQQEIQAPEVVLYKPQAVPVTPFSGLQLYSTLLGEKFENIGNKSPQNGVTTAIELQKQARREATERAHSRLDQLSKRARLAKMLASLAQLQSNNQQ